jgi:hypothetical protein
VQWLELIGGQDEQKAKWQEVGPKEVGTWRKENKACYEELHFAQKEEKVTENLSSGERQKAYDSAVGDIAHFSESISELCKFVWAGSLAIFYALIVSEPSGSAEKLVGAQRPILFIAAIAGSLAFLFDYLQKISAYTHACYLANWIGESDEEIPLDEYNSKTTSIWSTLNNFFFILKNISVLMTAALLAYVMIAVFIM